MKYLQALVFSVFICFSAHAWAGAYEDFFRAIEVDDLGTIQQLQAKGFDLNTPNPQLAHPVLLAIRADSLKAAAYLIQQPDVQIDQANSAGETPLMLAAIRGHVDIARQLIERDAQVNKAGWTPLHYAASSSHEQAVQMTRLLLDHYAYIDAESPNGATPLIMAVRFGDSRVVDLLLDEGADPTLKDKSGKTAWDWAMVTERQILANRLFTAIMAFDRLRWSAPRQQP